MSASDAEYEKSVQDFIDSGLEVSMGDAKVWCCVSGELIEADFNSSGRNRWHLMDMQSVDRSVESHYLVSGDIAYC